MALEDVQIGAANPAGADLDQRRLGGTAGLGTSRITGGAPGPAKVATRTLAMFRSLINRLEGIQ